MIKLKTSLSWKFGQKNILPEIGSIQYSENGEFEIDDLEIAKELVSLLDDLSIVEYSNITDETENKNIIDFNSLKYKNKQDLIQVGVDLGLDEEELKKLSVNDLKEQLKSKL